MAIAMKLAFTASARPEAQEALQRLRHIYGQVSEGEAEVVVALGGDGHMLETLRRRLAEAAPDAGIDDDLRIAAQRAQRFDAGQDRAGALVLLVFADEHQHRNLQPLDFGRLRSDLTVALTKFDNPIIGWHDPNFGIRFDDLPVTPDRVFEAIEKRKRALERKGGA